MLIHSVLDCSEVNGPGKRAVLWFQGCDLQCPGCWNADTHQFHGKHQTWSEVFDRINRIPGIEGVTFSGGEPLQQLNDGLDMVVDGLKRSERNLSVGLYTGYTEKELSEGNYRWSVHPSNRDTKKEKRVAWNRLCRQLDFAVMGRFNRDQIDSSRPLCSSRNQKLVLFSDRYRLEDFRPQETEFIISAESVTVTGFPPAEAV